MDHREPVIVRQQIFKENSKLENLRIEREERRRNRLPELPGKIKGAGQRIEEGTQEWVTRSLLETRKKFDGVFHDDPDGKMRKLESDHEQWSKKIKEYTEALERDQT